MWYGLRERNPDMTTLPPPVAPHITYHVLLKSLSRNRLAGYSLDTDADSSDAIARYLWNLQIVAAFSPILNTLEVAFRNAIFEVGTETTKGRNLRPGQIPCWLDATPSILQEQEAQQVREAITRLGRRTRRHSPGHLVSQLGFGFWIRLCDSPYEHGNPHGPGIWPTAAKRFPNCPRSERSRAHIRHAFNEIREFRNIVAHHRPVWDKPVLKLHSRAIELIGWMNARLGEVAAHHSPLPLIISNGHAAWRDMARESFVAAERSSDGVMGG